MRTLLSITLLINCLPVIAQAVEVAPRLSDREIIEALADIRGDIKALDQRFENIDQRFESIDQRFESIDQRFQSIDQRFESINQQFESINQRIDDTNRQLGQRIDDTNRQLGQRIDDMNQQLTRSIHFVQNLMLTMIAAVFGLIGYIIWDRKTAMRPLENRLTSIETALEHDLELKSPEGSRLTRLIHALRELAATNKQVASVLRSFSLL